MNIPVYFSAEHILFIANGIYQSEVCNSYNISRIRAAMEVMFSNYYTFITFNAWTGIAIKVRTFSLRIRIVCKDIGNQ